MSDKLQKLLAHAGLGSRRELETWIEAGRVTVNGKRAKLGDRADPQDRILVDGKPVRLTSEARETITAILYHKPEGEICTRKDPKGRPTMFDNLPAIANGRWVSVGRLDINTSGLILLTNNGQLANKLMHPSTGLEREYLVRVRGRVSPSDIQTLTRDGVELDGKSARFDRILAADMAEEGTNHWYRVVIREGRYREVRRLWEAVGHTVSRLKRIRYGTVSLPRSIKQGHHAKLAPKQLERLVISAGLAEQFSGQLYSSKSGAKPGPKPARSAQRQAKESQVKRSTRSSRAGGKPRITDGANSQLKSDARSEPRSQRKPKPKAKTRTKTRQRG